MVNGAKLYLNDVYDLNAPFSIFFQIHSIKALLWSKIHSIKALLWSKIHSIKALLWSKGLSKFF